MIWQFITSSDLSLWSRVKREQGEKGKKGGKVAEWTREEIEGGVGEEKKEI